MLIAVYYMQIFSEHPLVKVDVYCNDYGTSPTTVKPNAALMSAILMFGTFFIAYFLKMFRNGKYLGRTVSLRIPQPVLYTLILGPWTLRFDGRWATSASQSPSSSWC